MKKWIALGITAIFGVGLLFSTQLEASTVDTTSMDMEDMIILALEDEYNAKATYEVIIEQYGEVKPFINIVKAEQTHIDLLLPLFETYQITLPEDVDKDTLVIPATIEEALSIGVDAEIANIALYEAFLETDIPDDVRVVFEKLMAASENHLEAFSKALNGSLGQGHVDGDKGFKQGPKYVQQNQKLYPRCGA